MNKELTTYILPAGAIRLEWRKGEEKGSKSAQLLQEEIYKQFTSDPESWLLYLSFSDHDVPLPPELDYWRRFTNLFARRLTKIPELETIRDKADVNIDDHELRIIHESIPPMTGGEYVSPETLKSIWDKLLSVFRKKIKSYNGSVQEFIQNYSRKIYLIGRVFFHLVENDNREFPFAFMATYSTRFSKEGKSKHLPLKYALEEYEHDQSKMLNLMSTVHQAARDSRLISGLLESGDLFLPLAWTADEACTFLEETPIYEKSGILCRIPNWWNGARPKFRLDFVIGDNAPSYVGMDAILNFTVKLCVGEDKLSEKEIKRLLKESRGLAYIRNRWVPMDHDKLKQTLHALKKAKSVIGRNGLSLKDAMRLQLNPKKLLGDSVSIDDVGVSNGDWLESVFRKTMNPQTIESVVPDKNFKAVLRPYQKEGVNWLYFMHKLSFGACLADDMGLGKTIQLLAFLNLLKAEKPDKASLLIIPASLISNWMNEISRFFPVLKVYIAHSDKSRGKHGVELEPDRIDKYDLVITTYMLAYKYEWLHEYQWSYVILDEAQAIKNPDTKQAKGIKKLKSRNRIIMTGTPIENRLTDLWSLFDFINPGLLGTPLEFKAFSRELRNNTSGYAKLKKIIRPYILRRMKTDRSVISDLPEKVEMKSYAILSKKQIALYQNLIEYIKDEIPKAEGIQRKGLILSSLMRFKQICNHPDQYLGEEDFREEDSGKFQRLKEICETIYQKREKVLVFTQFKKITKPLSDFMASIFEREGLILNGSTPIGRRKEIVEKFQGNAYVPFIILTLKAGGVGLNLTEGSHVIHFDRWWNPAVENQATDRAFRIGQKKNVIVHKFLTKGTIEEKISTMIEEKSSLSEEIIDRPGEKWITEMKNEDLIELFTLNI